MCLFILDELEDCDEAYGSGIEWDDPYPKDLGDVGVEEERLGIIRYTRIISPAFSILEYEEEGR